MTTTRLAGPVSLSTDPTEIYVPSGAVIVTGIHVTSRSQSVAAFSLFVSRSMLAAESTEPLTETGTEFFAIQQVSPGKAYDWTGELPLASGDALVASSEFGSLTITVVGG